MSESRVREGTSWLLAAQLVFFLTSYALHIVLGRTLGPVDYGLFGVVLYATNMIRTMVQSGVPMAVTRYVSAEPSKSEAIYRTGFRLQLGFSLLLGLAFYLTAEPLARLLGDEKLAEVFRLAAPIIVFFGLFFLIFQYHNGLKQYRRQSVLLSGSYLLRAGLAIGLVWMGFGLSGAVAGMVLAAILAWIWAVRERSKGQVEEPFSAGVLVSFSAPLIVGAVAQALLTDLDIMFVKRLIPEAASTGWYTAAKALAQMTPFAFYALSSALYPAISGAQAAGDTDKVRRYVEQSNRLLLAVTLPLVILGWRNAEGIIQLVYGNDYQGAVPALGWLLISFALLSFFIVHKTILTGCGYPKISALLTLSLLPLSVVLLLLIIPVWGLPGAAMAVMLTFAVGVLISTSLISSRIKAGFRSASVLRIFSAGLATLGADLLWSSFSPHVLIKLGSGALLYLFLLRLFNEWRWDFTDP
jgi:O-antigen/teichoic acid export membrane protein